MLGLATTSYTASRLATKWSSKLTVRSLALPRLQWIGDMTPPDTKTPLCPKHHTHMVPHTFQTWELLAHGTVSGFRCPNLICAILHVRGAFYTLEANGELTPSAQSD